MKEPFTRVPSHRDIGSSGEPATSAATAAVACAQRHIICKQLNDHSVTTHPGFAFRCVLRGVQVLARELKAVHIDMDLAPVIDVDTNPANPV